MKTVQIRLNEMEAKVYDICKEVAQSEGDNGMEVYFPSVSKLCTRRLGLSEQQTKGYISSLKKKDAIRILSDSYFDFIVVELVEDDYYWCFLDDLYKVDIILERSAA